jgi:hypothetical protein
MKSSKRLLFAAFKVIQNYSKLFEFEFVIRITFSVKFSDIRNFEYIYLIQKTNIRLHSLIIVRA